MLIRSDQKSMLSSSIWPSVARSGCSAPGTALLLCPVWCLKRYERRAKLIPLHVLAG